MVRRIKSENTRKIQEEFSNTYDLQTCIKPGVEVHTLAPFEEAGKEKAAPAISTDAALSKISGIYQT